MGLAGRMIEFALEHAKGMKNIEHIWTYTPHSENIIKWHEKNGAEFSGYIVEDARPFYRDASKHQTPNVCIMDYSKLLGR